MARIVGNLVPEDDYTHPLGPEPNFNESAYFNFFDPERHIGGFVRLGNRANEGRAEKTVTLYLPDGRVLFSFGREPISNNEAFDAGGLRFEVLTPAQKLRTSFEGRVLELREPRRMAEPREAFRDSPRLAVSLDLVHDAVGPMAGSSGSRQEQELPAEQQFARAHYEQHMAVEGELQIEGERFPIQGFGLRDHSWGPRHWQAIHGYEWLTLNFGADFGAALSFIRRAPGEERVGGMIVRGDEIEGITGGSLKAEYAADGLEHRCVEARVETTSGQTLEFQGDVQSYIPLRNRREGLLTHIGEGMTRWRCGERTGYGLSEFLRQVR